MTTPPPFKNEPFLDFSAEKNRASMIEALHGVEKQSPRVASSLGRSLTATRFDPLRAMSEPIRVTTQLSLVELSSPTRRSQIAP